MIALILHSCYRLTKLGMKDWIEWALAAAAFAITVAMQAEVALVFIACGVVGLLYYGSLFRGRKATFAACGDAQGLSVFRYATSAW